MGGGTKAGTTPAFDTPTVCSDKKSIKLTKKKKIRTNFIALIRLISISVTNSRFNLESKV